jgi:hypothetical protein
LLVVALLLLLGLATAQGTLAGSAQRQPLDFRCVAQSFSAKASSTAFFWKAVNNCDREVGVHTLLVELQVLDWSDWPEAVRWVHDRDIGEFQATFRDWYGKSGTIDVSPYVGMHCYRIYTVHAVLAIQQVFGDTVSPPQCF